MTDPTAVEPLASADGAVYASLGENQLIVFDESGWKAYTVPDLPTGWDGSISPWSASLAVGTDGLLWAGTLTKGIAAQPFALPHWSLSFPLAALAALPLRLATPGSAMAVLGPALLALASLVVLALLLGTLRGLRDGSLLAPEPVAFIVAAAP